MSIRSERIKSLVDSSGLSYQELEKLTGIKKSSLQRYASGVTAKMETRFRKPVLIEQAYIELRARLREQKRNIAVVDGEIRSAEGELLAECSCTYFTFDPSRAPEQVPYLPTETIGEDLTKEEILGGY